MASCGLAVHLGGFIAVACNADWLRLAPATTCRYVYGKAPLQYSGQALTKPTPKGLVYLVRPDAGQPRGEPSHTKPNLGASRHDHLIVNSGQVSRPLPFVQPSKNESPEDYFPPASTTPASPRISDCSFVSHIPRALASSRPDGVGRRTRSGSACVHPSRETLTLTSTKTKRTQHVRLGVVGIVAVCYDQLFDHFGW